VVDSEEERDSLRSFLARRQIFTSIHWPTHPLVRSRGPAIEETLWIERHSLAFPVSTEYDLDDMRRIVDAVGDWARG
jgi:hypothetical protein